LDDAAATSPTIEDKKLIAIVHDGKSPSFADRLAAWKKDLGALASQQVSSLARRPRTLQEECVARPF
jgi:hypothetical protein